MIRGWHGFRFTKLFLEFEQSGSQDTGANQRQMESVVDNNANDRGWGAIQTMSERKKGQKTVKPSKPLIYVAEDDIQLLDLIGMMLGVEGYDCAKFINGEQALAAMAAANPGPRLIISDYAMGERNLNGVEFLAACKRLDPKVKAFLISGTVDESMIRVDSRPVDWFLAKPFDMAELLRITRDLLKA